MLFSQLSLGIRERRPHIINDFKFGGAQVPFGQLLDYYLEQFVRNPEKLAASTRNKYETHIENHVRPAWKDIALCEIRGLEIDRWLTEKSKPRVVKVGEKEKIVPGLSWNTRTDLRNLMSGIFTKAQEWGFVAGREPCCTGECWAEENGLATSEAHHGTDAKSLGRTTG